MPRSKFFRIAVEGGTTDGRTIERNWLEEMAADYRPDTYTARVNMEHLRGFSPEPPFNAYGDVLALETRDVELTIAGKKQTRLGLYAQLDVTDELVAINEKRQKLFTSCEIAPNFAGQGRAYLVGLAVTDSPASLGTEMLSFAAGQGDANPLANRKQDPANLFTAADELQLELEAETPASSAPAADDDVAQVRGLIATFAGLVARFTGTPAQEPAQEPAQAPEATVEAPEAPAAPEAPQAPAQAPANDNLEGLAETLSQLSTVLEPLAGLPARVDELAAKLDATPENFSRRPLASGSNGRVRTDC